MKLRGKWKRLSGAVFESANGTRIHMLGLIQCQKQINVESGKHISSFLRSMDICGGNRKRALMLIAENISDLEC